jgi:hypothetical protein
LVPVEIWQVTTIGVRPTIASLSAQEGASLGAAVELDQAARHSS